MLPIIKRAALIACDGNYSELARLIRAPRAATYVWLKVPPEYAKRIVDVTKGKIKRSEIRPDLWPPRKKRK